MFSIVPLFIKVDETPSLTVSSELPLYILAPELLVSVVPLEVEPNVIAVPLVAYISPEFVTVAPEIVPLLAAIVLPVSEDIIPAVSYTHLTLPTKA